MNGNYMYDVQILFWENHSKTLKIVNLFKQVIFI